MLGVLSSAASLDMQHSVEGVRAFLHFHSSHLANKVRTSCNSLRADAIVAVGGRWKINFLSASRMPRSTQISLPVMLTLLYRKYLQVQEQVWSSHCWGIKTWKYPFLILKSLHYNNGTRTLKRQFTSLTVWYLLCFYVAFREKKTRQTSHSIIFYCQYHFYAFKYHSKITLCKKINTSLLVLDFIYIKITTFRQFWVDSFPLAFIYS